MKFKARKNDAKVTHPDVAKNPYHHGEQNSAYPQEHAAEKRRDLQRRSAILATEPVAHVFRRFLQLMAANRAVWHRLEAC